MADQRPKQQPLRRHRSGVTNALAGRRVGRLARRCRCGNSATTEDRRRRSALHMEEKKIGSPSYCNIEPCASRRVRSFGAYLRTLVRFCLRPDECHPATVVGERGAEVADARASIETIPRYCPWARRDPLYREFTRLGSAKRRGPAFDRRERQRRVSAACELRAAAHRRRRPTASTSSPVP
jgi:hypothetical protein